MESPHLPLKSLETAIFSLCFLGVLLLVGPPFAGVWWCLELRRRVFTISSVAEHLLLLVSVNVALFFPPFLRKSVVLLSLGPALSFFFAPYEGEAIGLCQFILFAGVAAGFAGPVFLSLIFVFCRLCVGRDQKGVNPSDSGLFLFSGKMAQAGDPNNPVAPEVPSEPFIYGWVHPSVLHWALEYTSLDSVEPFSQVVVRGGNEGYAVVEPCNAGEPMCYRPESSEQTETADQFTFVYGTMLSKLVVRFPLTDFECDVLRTLNIAPTQLHSNGWGFIREFAIVCQGIGSVPQSEGSLVFSKPR